MTSLDRLYITLQGVLGIARSTRVDGGTHCFTWETVTPARILISSLSDSASFMPGWLRIVSATWGLQLVVFISFRSMVTVKATRAHPRIMTSAASTDSTFLWAFSSTIRPWSSTDNDRRRRVMLSCRLTQAMNRDGPSLWVVWPFCPLPLRCGFMGLALPFLSWSSLISFWLLNTPESIDTPIVPHPT